MPKERECTNCTTEDWDENGCLHCNAPYVGHGAQEQPPRSVNGSTTDTTKGRNGMKKWECTKPNNCKEDCKLDCSYEPTGCVYADEEEIHRDAKIWKETDK